MTGCKSFLWKILSAVVVVTFMLPRLALGEFGVCPPYSKTFGPDDSAEEVLAFINEINLRPGGGTVILMQNALAVGGSQPIEISGIVCIKATDPNFEIIGRFDVGGILTLEHVFMVSDAYDVRPVYVARGATLFAQSSYFMSGFVNEGVAYLVGSTAGHTDPYTDLEAMVINRGTLIMTGGHISGSTFVGLANEGSGYALLDSVYVSGNGGQLGRGGSPGITAGGRGMSVIRSTIVNNGGCDEWHDPYNCWGDGIIGGFDIAQSVVANNKGDDCVGGTDLGYNVIGTDSSCAVEVTSIVADPLMSAGELGPGSPAIDIIPLEFGTPTDALGRARTDGNGDGIVACDAGALEYGYVSVPVTVRTVPYLRAVGRLDLTRDTALFVSVFSTVSFDATSILFDTIDIEGLSEGAKRGPVLQDANRDGWLDIAFWYRLDRMPQLACGSYDQRFEAMTEDGRMVSGQLRFEVVGCTP